MDKSRVCSVHAQDVCVTSCSPKTSPAQMEYLYYSVPQDVPVLALSGDNQVRHYGDKGLNLLHFHNLLQIGYCWEGQGNIAVGEAVFPFQNGTLWVIPRDVCHTTVSENGVLCHNEYLFIDVAGFTDNLPVQERRNGVKLAEYVNCGAFILSGDQNPALRDAILALIRELKCKKQLYQMNVNALLMTLFIEIARDHMHRSGGIEIEFLVGHKHRLVIHEAVSFIEAHYGEDIHIGNIADYCHVSQTHLRRLFQAALKMGPLDYINMVRVQTACELLKSTEYSMEIIAGQAGFYSVSSFNRHFHRQTGLTPMQWRKNPQKRD